jgi:hypothetical protein
MSLYLLGLINGHTAYRPCGRMTHETRLFKAVGSLCCCGYQQCF